MTLNELQILLALNGNERIEYAESEIFASEELYTCYLESLNSNHWWYKGYHKGESGELAWLACKYAKDVIGARWHVAEHVIVKDRIYAAWYNGYFGTNM